MRPEDKLRKAADYAGMSADTRATVWRGIEEQMKKELASGAGAEDVLRSVPQGEGGKAGTGTSSTAAREKGVRGTRGIGGIGGIGGRRWRRPGALGSGPAAIAGLVIVAGGLWVASHGGLFGVHGSRTFGASNATANTPGIGPVGSNSASQRGTMPLKLPPSWSRIVVTDSSPTPNSWSPVAFTQTEAKLKSLLQGATPVQVTIPASGSSSSGTGAYIGPAVLELTSGGQTTAIEPAYYFVNGMPSNSGVSSNNAAGQQAYSEILVHYIPDVIAVEDGQETNYYRDAAMYNWLKNNIWKSEFQTGMSANNTQYSDAQLAATTPAELAAYNVQHGSPLPFASGDMVRNVPSQLLLVSDPKSGSILGSQYVQATPGVDAGTTHSAILAVAPSDQFQVVDSWTGTVGSQQGVTVEVDRKTDGSEYIVAIGRGPRENAYSFAAQVLITNFTGSYMVFIAENNHFYALNLQTGSLIQGTTAAQMSSDYRSVGTMIVGLPKTYAAQPVIGGKSY